MEKLLVSSRNTLAYIYKDQTNAAIRAGIYVSTVFDVALSEEVRYGKCISAIIIER